MLVYWKYAPEGCTGNKGVMWFVFWVLGTFLRVNLFFSKVTDYYPAHVLQMNLFMGISQWSWLRISPAYACNTYSFQEHLFYRTLLVAFSVQSQVQCGWFSKIIVIVFFIYGHLSLLHNIFKIKIVDAFSEHCRTSEVRAFYENS